MGPNGARTARVAKGALVPTMFQKPSVADLRRAAQQLGMNPSDDYLRAVGEIITPLVSAYAALDAEPDELPSVKYPRGPAHRPQGAENRTAPGT